MKAVKSVCDVFLARSVYVRAGVLIIGLGLSAAAVATPTLAMTARMLQSGCSVSFIQGEQVNGTPVTSITIPDTDPAVLTSPGGACSGSLCIDIAHSTPVTLKLSGCGLAQDSTTPTVTLTGVNALQDDVPSSTKSLGYLFRDAGQAGGTSKEFGVVVGKVQSVQWNKSYMYNSSAGLAGGDAPNSIIALSDGGKGTSGEGAYSTLWLAVSCGNGCNSSNTQSGTLNASLTFSFSYK